MIAYVGWSIALEGDLGMFRDNVIWVDFRLSKDIRDKAALSFTERMNMSSVRTRGHLEAPRTALEAVKRMLAGPQHTAKPTDKA